MKVTIVGAGALGSHLVLLARNWQVELGLIDFDRVESKNTQSQFHSLMGMGKNKAMALKAVMVGMWKRQIQAVPTKLMGNNRQQLLTAADLLIDCTDNFKARDIIQEMALELDIPCLHCCLSADGQFARIVWTEHFHPDKEDVDGEATCEDGRNLAFHAMAAAVTAQVIMLYLDDDVKQSWQLTPFSMVRLT
jgi:molybdopterin/thiamine biosynthesis adenylyltransferase